MEVQMWDFFMTFSIFVNYLHSSLVFLDTVAPNSRRHFLALKTGLPFQLVLCHGNAGTLLPLRAMCFSVSRGFLIALMHI